MRTFAYSLGCAMMACLVACHSSPDTPPTDFSPAAASIPMAASVPVPPQTIGVDIRKDRIGGDFTLIDATGQPFSLSSLTGKVVILAFGFANCPDVCPTELLTYREAIQQLGEQAEQVAVVFVSVDPERDTPEVIGKYVQTFHPKFIGLTDVNHGADLATVKKQYRIVSAKTEVKSDTAYNMDHSSGAYILDKKGNAVLYEPYGATATQIAADVKTLLAP